MFKPTAAGCGDGLGHHALHRLTRPDAGQTIEASCLRSSFLEKVITLHPDAEGEAL